ncbi:MAG: enolase C-terminal domain-like protein [Victivallales bacterium]|jgi:L-alanine-DL-glutamate epimerase-like enolase superfamily enzyme
MKTTDVKIREVEIRFIPVTLRLPLKFGAETITSGTCARVRMSVENGLGKTNYGYGETPISVGWAWPSPSFGFLERENRMIAFCRKLISHWENSDLNGHAMEVGHAFNENILPEIDEAVPHLAQLICNSAFDLALHDAYGKVNDISSYNSYNSQYMNQDLGFYFGDSRFNGKYPEDYLLRQPLLKLPVWHLVGGKDLLTKSELTGNEPQDGYPVTLTEWIRRDGLKCLKIKLTGTDSQWDCQRMLEVGNIAIEYKVKYLSADFNCMVKSPQYVNDILDKLKLEAPEIYGRILYVEQPFPYDLEANRIDVHSVSGRKPLFMDESAHDWRFVKLGHELGWTGVALKVCKTQTGALLSAAWAKEYGMAIMVQDLTNPMLAMIPHVQLASRVGTIMGVECNAQQFYPAASAIQEKNHPYLYRRRHGVVDLSTLGDKGLGYKEEDLTA